MGETDLNPNEFNHRDTENTELRLKSVGRACPAVARRRGVTPCAPPLQTNEGLGK